MAVFPLQRDEPAKEPGMAHSCRSFPCPCHCRQSRSGATLLASTRETLISDPTMLELKLKTTSGNFSTSRSAVENKQPRKQLLALTLLLVTFGVLIAKDHDFWFGSDDSTDSDVVNSGVAQSTAQPIPSAAVHVVPAPPASASSLKKQTKAQAAAPAPSNDSGIVATERTALPPLDVEV